MAFATKKKCIFRFINVFVPLLIGAIIFLSCENNVEDIKAATEEVNIPSMESVNIEIIQTDSGIVSFRMLAPLLVRYADVEKPYVEFPEGIQVFGYDDNENVQSSITADYAKHLEGDQVWIAERNVVATNQKDGNVLYTEYMVWDMKMKMLSSEKFCRIETPNGKFRGENGFEADENFSKWELRKAAGDMEVRDE